MRGKASCFYTHIHATDNTLTHVHTYTYTHTVFEMLAQYQMIWMLLSMTVGWTHTLSTAQPKKEKTRGLFPFVGGFSPSVTLMMVLEL